MVAAHNGHLKIVEMLIASKANVNHQKNVSCLWFVYLSYDVYMQLPVCGLHC